jgi:hypothetical protein
MTVGNLTAGNLTKGQVPSGQVPYCHVASGPSFALPEGLVGSVGCMFSVS